MMGSIHSISATRGGVPGCRTSATASFTAWEGEAQAHRKLSARTTVREILQEVHAGPSKDVHSELRLLATSTSSSSSIECVAISCALPMMQSTRTADRVTSCQPALRCDAQSNTVQHCTETLRWGDSVLQIALHTNLKNGLHLRCEVAAALRQAPCSSTHTWCQSSNRELSIPEWWPPSAPRRDGRVLARPAPRRCW